MFNTMKYCKDYLATPSYKKEIYAFRYILDINKYLPKRKLLDIGCATGEMMKIAQRSNYDCYGIDISEPLVNIAKKSKLNVKVSTIEKEKYPDQMFDVITILSVIQYIKNKVKFLEEVKRILRDDGILLIHCPKPHMTPLELFELVSKCGFASMYIRTGIADKYCEIICKKM